MCGRFALVQGPRDVGDVFAVEGIEPFPQRYNIAPTQPILLVMAGPRRDPGSNLPDRKAILARWGLIPGWAQNPAELPLLINARSETAAEKAAFKAAMRHRRALIPASGFYEWQRAGGRTGPAYWVRPRSGELIAFAALMETYAEPGGSEIDTAAILTTRANTDVAHVHDRMPVVIRQEHFSRWLDCVACEPRDMTDLLEPAEPHFFEAVPVSDKVNKIANVGPELLERVNVAEEPPRQMSLF